MWTSPEVYPIPTAFRLNGQGEPSGQVSASASMMAAVTLPQSAHSDGSWTYSPAAPLGRNPYNPGGVGGYPLDRDPAVEQALMNGTGTRMHALGDAGRLTGFFLGARIHPDGAYIATLSTPVVLTLDFFAADSEIRQRWVVSSNYEGGASTILQMLGYESSDAQAEPDGHVLRPEVLAGIGVIGDYFSPPRDPAPGLPTFVCKTGEWYTVAVRLSINTINVFIRDSGTDGTTFLIDDARDFQGFETGWACVYPGEDAVQVAGNTWRGYGRAVERSGRPAPRPGVLIGARVFDNLYALVGGDPTMVQVPQWRPSNCFFDNFTVIGDTLEQATGPLLRLPFLDDFERYPANAQLGYAEPSYPHSWAVSASGCAAIDPAFNATPAARGGAAPPTQSVWQENYEQNSVMRQEFYGYTAPGFATLPLFDPAQRAYARPGGPVSLSAQLRVSAPTTVRAMTVLDDRVDNSVEEVLTGVATPNGTGPETVTSGFHIRTRNPLFDRALPTPADEALDEPPVAGRNTECLNWPTTSGTPIGSFFKTELAMYGDGTCEWRVDGTPLVFDPAFYTQDPGLEEFLAVAKRIELGLPASAPVSGPYTRFPSATRSVDRVGFWSGNNVGGFGDTLHVDDVRVDATPRVVGSGPALEIPYADDFSEYNADEAIANQGVGPSPQNPTGTQAARLQPVRGSWLASGSYAPSTEWCSYAIDEVIPQFDAQGMVLPDQWGVAPGQAVYMRNPFPGYTCPTRTSTVGVANFTLLDPAPSNARRPAQLRVGAPSDEVGDGSAATFRADDDRHLASSYFCRYQLSYVTPTSDPTAGGAPYPVPAGWAPGAIIAIDSVFPPLPNGARPCDGSLVAFTGFYLVGDLGQRIGYGAWKLVSSVVPACGGTTPVGSAVNSIPNTDVRGHGPWAIATPRWDNLIDATFAASGRAGDGWLRESASSLDAAKSAAQGMDVSIDPTGRFGQVLELKNVDFVQPAARKEYLDAAATLPTARSTVAGLGVNARNARMCFDLYVQDLNTRLSVTLSGDQDDCDGGTGLVAALRFGGPDPDDGVPSNHIAYRTSATQVAYADTGVEVPVGEWFRVCFEIDAAGMWRAGMNTFGAPGGPGGPTATGGDGGGDRPEFYDQSLPGAHPDAVFIRSGVALTNASSGGAPLHTLNRVAIAQGADDQGDGVTPLGPVTVQSLGPTAQRPAGLGPLDFCFYELDSLAPGPSIQIANVDALTGSSDTSPPDGQPDLRAISANYVDVVAVRFNTNAGSGPVVTSFEECPLNSSFALLEPGTGTVGATGTWSLLHVPDYVHYYPVIPTGVTNAAGPGAIAAGGNLLAYNDPDKPPQPTLLARFDSIAPVPPAKIASRWWLDNLRLDKRIVCGTAGCAGDLSGDGQINAVDLALLLGAWGGSGPADLTGDGVVNAADLAQLLGAWGPCPSGC